VEKFGFQRDIKDEEGAMELYKTIIEMAQKEET